MTAIDDDGTFLKKSYMLEVMVQEKERITIGKGVKSYPFFQRILLDGKYSDHVKCTKCTTVDNMFICKYTKNSGTRTMRNHCKNIHPELYIGPTATKFRPIGAKAVYTAKPVADIAAAMRTLNKEIYPDLNHKARACYHDSGLKTSAGSNQVECNFCDYYVV